MRWVFEFEYITVAKFRGLIRFNKTSNDFVGTLGRTQTVGASVVVQRDV